MSFYSALNKRIDLFFSIQTLSIIGFCIVLKKTPSTSWWFSGYFYENWFAKDHLINSAYCVCYVNCYTELKIFNLSWRGNRNTIFEINWVCRAFRLEFYFSTVDDSLVSRRYHWYLECLINKKSTSTSTIFICLLI